MDSNRPRVNAVVDTNVVAYYLLGAERFVAEAREFMTALDQGWAPTLWEAELANVLWMATRHKVLSISESANRLALADGLGIHTVPNRMLWQGALLRAHQTNIPVYDTLFVELAIREELPLATFDAALQRAFPDVARRPAAVPRTSRPL
jgi:predicted nucleic acid-binding protein